MVQYEKKRGQGRTLLRKNKKRAQYSICGNENRVEFSISGNTVATVVFVPS